MKNWKILALTAAFVVVLGTVFAFAGSSQLVGKVVAVAGKTVTIELQSGDVSQVKEGSTMELNVIKEKAPAPPAAGNDMLQGC